MIFDKILETQMNSIAQRDNPAEQRASI